MDQNDKINFEYLKKYINEGDVLVDIGANTGIYTQYFNDVTNGNSKIYSIEMHPYNFKLLSNKYKNYKNIILENKAISNSNGIIDFYIGRGPCTHNIIGHDMNFNKNQKGGEIESITLDKLLENEEHIKLIKIDVEGAEKLVLKGMEKTILKTDYIFIECHLNEDWKEIRGLLLNEYELTCSDITETEFITKDNQRMYQCLCKTNNNA